MATTYEPISTTTLGSNTATVTISGFPSTYTDLRLVVSVNRALGAGDLDMQFNGDTGTNYFNQGQYIGSASLNTISSLETKIRCTWYNALPTDTSIQALAIYDILNYANPNAGYSWQKNIHVSYSNPVNATSNVSGDALLMMGSWSASAITSITLFGSTFLAGSTFTLFGIKGAS